MARRTRKRAQSSAPSGSSRSGTSLHAALDPLSSLLKGAGLRRSEPAETRSETPKKSSPAAKKRKKRRSIPKPGPLATSFPDMPGVKGVRLATVAAGIVEPGRRDMMVATFSPGTQVAGVFSQSKTVSAPVEWSRKSLANDNPEARVLVVHAGNANAFTGKHGDDAAKEIAAAAAKTAKCRQRDVFQAGTGVIGQRLPVKKVTSKISPMIRGGSMRPWLSAARSIMTTDTFPKGATRTVEIDGVKVTLCAIAKGSSMVAPDLATALGFVFTDAEIPSDVLQALLLLSARGSFNSITIDGDVSPSDTVFAFATGQAKLETPVTRVGDRRLSAFRKALTAIMKDLALQIVADGIGAKKLVHVTVNGAASTAAASTIARAVATSTLVKISIGAEEPDWGRIIAAIGKSGEQVDRDKLKLLIGDVLVVEDGEAAPEFAPKDLLDTLKAREIEVEIDVGVGRGAASVWTSDLTQRYITLSTGNRS